MLICKVNVDCRKNYSNKLLDGNVMIYYKGIKISCPKAVLDAAGDKASFDPTDHHHHGHRNHVGVWWWWCKCVCV